jgi:glycosyltransferase involved in cell wall biosynthesis
MNAVTICIPAYHAEAFLAATIESALAQTYPQTRVVVSVDPADDSTASIVSGFATRGVRLVEQGRRLGWVGNANAALALAETSHAMILPHDDLLHPDYVSACMGALIDAPDAVLAYSDIRFGWVARMWQEPVLGILPDRMRTYVDQHFDAVAFRGVFDRARAGGHEIPAWGLGHYAADTLWVARILSSGSIVRVPRVLYRKKLRPASVHAGWKRASPTQMDEKWIIHCLELEGIVREVATWDDALEAAWEKRLMRRLNQSRRQRRTASLLDPALPLRPQTQAVLARVLERTDN